MTTLKSFPCFPPHLGRDRRQMTFLILPLPAVGHHATDSDHITSPQSTIPVWSLHVVNTSVRLASLRKFGTFAQAKEFSTWHTART
jgi:hypothetical protein